MKTVESITTALRAKELHTYTASTYTMMNDTLVRVSNHLPNSSNISENNEGVERIFLIFAESDLNELQVDKHIEKELYNYEVEYMIINDSFDFSIEDILTFINNF